MVYCADVEIHSFGVFQEDDKEVLVVFFFGKITKKFQDIQAAFVFFLFSRILKDEIFLLKYRN